MTPGFYFGFGILTGALALSCIDQPEPTVLVPAYPHQLVLADGFDFPVGPPHAKGYYNAQKFGQNNHLGDDWNGVGGGNSDFGDTVYAVANGVCSHASNYFGGWGKVARIQHSDGFQNTESLYAHFSEMWVHVGDTIARGQAIGTIGNAEGIYLAHLHLEIRNQWNRELGAGYSAQAEGYLDPTAYIKAHRPTR